MAVTNPRTVRILGGVTMFCGAALIVGMGLLIHGMGDMLSNPGQRTAGGSTFNGTPDQAWWILRLFWTVLGFGLVALGAGAWQVKTGRRDRIVAILLVIAFVILMLMTWRTIALLR